MSIIVSTLQEKYFALLLKENYPTTPTITREADELERRIKVELAYEQLHAVKPKS